jgi:hypothetical protein
VYEIALPVQGWGENALVGDIPDRPLGSIYKVIASEDGTSVSLDGAVVANLNEGQVYQTTETSGNHVFTGDKPISVYQFMTGKYTTGDPAMANIIPPEQFLNKYTFSTVGGSQFVRHFVAITVANNDVNSITIDGNPINPNIFTAIGTTGFSYGFIDLLAEGTHTTQSPNGHGILVGGYNNFDSYLYPGGAAFEFINPQPEDDRDGDGVFDINDACPDEFAQTIDGCPLSGPIPITEIQCSYNEPTGVFLNETALDYTVNGSCDIHRGDDIQMKNMTLNVFKEFNPIGQLLTPPVYLTGSYIYSSNADGSTPDAGFLFSSDTSPLHAFMPIDMVGDNPDAGVVDRLQSFLLQPGDNTFVFDLEFSRAIYGLGLFFDTAPVPFVATEPVVGQLVGYSSADNNPNVSVPEAGTLVTDYHFSKTALPYSGAVEASWSNANVKITEFKIENNPGPQGHFTVNLGELVQPCSDQTGTFTITFDDESGSVTVNETGEICQHIGFLNFTGTNTSVQGTGEYEDIGPQCGNVDATITLGGDYATANSIRTHTIPSNSATGTVSVTQCEVPEPKKNNGGDNQWDTRPTFGISHEDRGTQVVENGFRFNNNEFMLTDNHHTDFAEQSVEIGTTNSFSATVYADKKLKIQEFLFGIPNVGEAHLAELGVEVWYDRDGNIDDVKVVQKSDVIDAETVSVSHEKVKCLSTDADARCDTTTVSMTFLEPLMDKVMAIKAIDYALRDQRTFLNEGFDISGESLNPMLAKMIPSNLRDQGLLKVTQVAKYSPYWQGEDGRMFEMNSFGSFKQINKSFERFQDTGSAFSRLHSEFGGMLAYEQDRATDVFDSSKLISEVPESFAYIFPESGERVTDEMLKQMQLQAEIAQSILDEMDKQDRHY